MNQFIKKLLRKQIVIPLVILMQLALIIFVVYRLSNYILTLYIALNVLSWLIVIYIINRPDNPSYKLSWSILILAIPVVGGVLYLLLGGKKIPEALQKDMVKSNNEKQPYMVQDPAVLDQIERQYPHLTKQVHYLYRNAFFPVYNNTQSTYLALGEDKFEVMKRELKKAQKFIFLEYFIVKEGVMWDSIRSILVEKAKAGVDVRLLYDDFGSIQLPEQFIKENNRDLIKTVVFNPLRPKLAIFMNNRDHRKICVIDGEVGFVGGINIGDEYINAVERFGHWKDTAAMIKGEAVWSLTVMFLTFYNYITKENEDILKFKSTKKPEILDGFVQPFSDSPTDQEPVGETVHLNLINHAKKYLYIQTPYLIIGHHILTALITAAKNGVDVRITLPHIPDKWYVHTISRSNYDQLIKAGVKVYEYKPGFIHAKMMVADDEVAFVGTTNMDFRSYYMHFECGLLFIGGDIINQILKDYHETSLESIQISEADMKKVNVFVRITRAILNLFSALL